MKSTVVKILVLPLFIVTCLTTFAALYQINCLQYTTSQLMGQPFQLDTTLSKHELANGASTVVLVLILSSWSSQSFERRQVLRDSSLKLLTSGSDKVSIAYRFIIGQPPSAQMQMAMGSLLVQESAAYHDIVVVPASDASKHKSRKVFEALQWSRNIKYDYLVKTDDDVFARWDIIGSELAALDPQTYYWKGLTYRNMPSDSKHADKSMSADYGLSILPAFTSGTLYTVSRDIVDLIVTSKLPRRFIAAEDHNFAVWLFGYNIEPIHDARIQDRDVCEEDQIAKRFSSADVQNMKRMYNNIISKQPQCAGLDSSACAVCYPCHGKKNDWRSSNLACDLFRGITLREQPKFTKVSGMAAKDVLPASKIGENDEWIVKDVLSKRTSIYSDSDEWHLLHWVCWSSAPSTFTDRHWRALELVWVHEPRAVVFMISNTLPENFFDEYSQHGYNVRVIHFDKERLLNWRWHFGSGTQDWLEDWEKWENGEYFNWHLTDYVRLFLLYNYGGVYMDMDALWIRAPPDPNLEFIGSDYSGLESDREWTLDDQGLYLPQGLMRFKRGWRFFREIAESAFSSYTYDPKCFNCQGPKAITTYIREHRHAVESNGFTILPREILYPVGYQEVQKLLSPNPLAEQELKTELIVNSWNIHLFGKMTNHLEIKFGSVIDLVFKQFDLDIPHRDIETHSIISSTNTWTVPMHLIGPRTYIYRAYTPRVLKEQQKPWDKAPVGKFQGLDVIYVRGGPPVSHLVKVEVKVARGKFNFGTSEEEFTSTSIELKSATKKDVNVLLNSLIYLPSPLLVANGGRDQLTINIQYDGGEKSKPEQDSIQVDIVVIETEDDDEN
ncbi:hypothetical protein DFQ28_009872 [Apophysomyces sp. BC1034]|nr:hypothetical protein DFQ28_009872 [Apophysomyces sp. BC1034]